MSFRIIDHDSDHHVTGENERGERLNFNVAHVLNPQIRTTTTDPASASRGLRIGGTPYVFEAGGVLSAHSHPAESLHNVEVVEGHVLVKRAISGDIEAFAGTTVDLLPGEEHSIHAFEPSRTVHWQLSALIKK